MAMAVSKKTRQRLQNCREAWMSRYMGEFEKKRSEFGDDKYRPLKKMMKESSKDITRSLTDKKLPPAMVMDDFIALVKVMISYPGYGDERYPSFMAACEALHRSFKDKDLAAFKECFAVVVSLKKECHRLFK